MFYDVCVLGGCSIDLMYYQKEDGTYGKSADKAAFGGKASNQAISCAKAGAKTIILTKLVNDEMGYSIAKNLSKNEVATKCIDWVKEGENSYSEVYINNTDKDNKINKHYGIIADFDEKLLNDNKVVIKNSKIIVLQLKCPMQLTESVIDFCYKNGVKISLTPCHPEKISGRDDLIDKLSYITCNEDEFNAVWQGQNIDDVLRRYPKKLIVTLGGDGLKYCDGKNIIKLDAQADNVVDTIGAGDCFCGNFIAQLSQGVSFEDAVWRANIASGYKVGFKGAQNGIIDKDELDKLILRRNLKDFEYLDKLEVAINGIREATKHIDRDEKYSALWNADSTFITKSKSKIEKNLCGLISDNFSDDNTVCIDGADGNLNLKNGTWVINAVDNVTHFLKNNDMWSTQLAYYDKGQIQFSIIYNKEKDELLYGALNYGVYLNDYKIKQNVKQLPLDKCVVEIGGSMSIKSNDKLIILRDLVKNEEYPVSNVTTINSIGQSYLNLLSGKVDALVTCTQNINDRIFGHFMCEELGYKKVFANKKVSSLQVVTKQDSILKYFANNTRNTDNVNEITK